MGLRLQLQAAERCLQAERCRQLARCLQLRRPGSHLQARLLRRPGSVHLQARVPLRRPGSVQRRALQVEWRRVECLRVATAQVEARADTAGERRAGVTVVAEPVGMAVRVARHRAEVVSAALSGVRAS